MSQKNLPESALREQMLAAANIEFERHAKNLELLRTVDLEVVTSASDIFQEPAGVAAWLTQPTYQIVGLGGKTPLEAAVTPKGKQAVLDLLVKIKYGTCA